MSALVEAEGLAIGDAGGTLALDGVTLALSAGETLAVIGESGSGKTTFGMALGRVLPAGARRVAGRLTVAGVEVFEADAETLRRLRREALGFVFQNPMSALDPTMTVGRQLARATGRRTPPAELAALLARARLDEPERVLRAWPHELSGGMAQRVTIAMAIARSPRLLIADEPTASLDASIRDRVMDTLGALSAEAGAALVVLSHDLRLAAKRAARTAVMYAGRVAEAGPTAALFARPSHPYTAALMAAAAGSERPGERLSPIPGAPPTLTESARGCAFAPRCPLAAEVCRATRPADRAVEGRQVACHRAEEMPAAPAAEAAR